MRSPAAHRDMPDSGDCEVSGGPARRPPIRRAFSARSVVPSRCAAGATRGRRDFAPTSAAANGPSGQLAELESRSSGRHDRVVRGELA